MSERYFEIICDAYEPTIPRGMVFKVDVDEAFVYGGHPETGVRSDLMWDALFDEECVEDQGEDPSGFVEPTGWSAEPPHQNWVCKTGDLAPPRWRNQGSPSHRSQGKHRPSPYQRWCVLLHWGGPNADKTNGLSVFG